MKLLDTIKKAREEHDAAVLKKMSDEIFKIIDNATVKNIVILKEDDNTIELGITAPCFKWMVDDVPTLTLNKVWTIMKNDHPEILDIKEHESVKNSIYLKIKK